jgi:hypothetical protein
MDSRSAQITNLRSHQVGDLLRGRVEMFMPADARSEAALVAFAAQDA